MGALNVLCQILLPFCLTRFLIRQPLQHNRVARFEFRLTKRSTKGSRGQCTSDEGSSQSFNKGRRWRVGREPEWFYRGDGSKGAIPEVDKAPQQSKNACARVSIAFIIKTKGSSKLANVLRLLIQQSLNRWKTIWSLYRRDSYIPLTIYSYWKQIISYSTWTPHLIFNLDSNL